MSKTHTRLLHRPLHMSREQVNVSDSAIEGVTKETYCKGGEMTNPEDLTPTQVINLTEEVSVGIHVVKITNLLRIYSRFMSSSASHYHLCSKHPPKNSN